MSLWQRLTGAQKKCDTLNYEIELVKIKYLMIAEKLGICWYYADKEGLTKDCGKHTLNLYKTDLETVIGTNWMDFVYPDDLPEVLSHWKYAVAMKKTFDMSFRTYIGNGDLIKIHSKARRVGDDYFGEINLL